MTQKSRPPPPVDDTRPHRALNGCTLARSLGPRLRTSVPLVGPIWVVARLGNGAWYLPAWLARLLPNVDIDGTKLERGLAPTDAARDQGEPEPAKV